jgi:hypothetical protein
MTKKAVKRIGITWLITLEGKGKGKAITVQSGRGPEGSRRLQLPDFLDSWHMKVVRLSALRTGRLYTTVDISGTHFC